MSAPARYAIEEVLIMMLQQSAALANYPKVHWDAAQKAVSDTFIVQADSMVQDLSAVANASDGTPKRFNADAMIHFRSSVENPQLNELLFNEALKAISFSQSAMAEAKKTFLDFILHTENMSDDRSATKNLRRWKMTIPVNVLLP